MVKIKTLVNNNMQAVVKTSGSHWGG